MTEPPARLDSWKDIAAYLKRDLSTVQRWEKREGMPVHRHLHGKLGTVYAYPEELDAWLESRKAPAATAHVRSTRPRWFAMIGAAAALAAAGIWFTQQKPEPADPLAGARYTRITDFDGIEQAAAISRDGRFVAFLSDRDGRVDVWVTQLGTNQFKKLTNGELGDLVNPDLRLVGFSPDGSLVTMWTRRSSVAVFAVPTLGGEPRPYLPDAAEFDWSSDGSRLVYHTPASGDPIFVTDKQRNAPRQLFAGPAGVHNHHLTWSPDDRSIYFVSGSANETDIYRVRADGSERPQRLTSHNSRVSHLTFADANTLLYLATDDDGGPWLHSYDLDRGETRRVSSGPERYTSLSADATRQRFVATIANPKRTLWRVPVSERVAEDSDASRIKVPIVGARSPKMTRDFIVYVSGESIWKLSGETAVEIWSADEAKIAGGPALAPDGRHVAFTAHLQGRNRLMIAATDGSSARALPDSLQPLGTPAWSPDGRSIAVAALAGGKPHLVRVSVTDGRTSTLFSEFAAEPAWSPDGAKVFWSGPDVGATVPVRFVTVDEPARSAPVMTLTRGARRLGFLPQQNALIVLKGDITHKNFWAVDLESGAERQLTNFGPGPVIRDFDVSPDGREIVFDREQDTSDIVLIERKRS